MLNKLFKYLSLITLITNDIKATNTNSIIVPRETQSSEIALVFESIEKLYTNEAALMVFTALFKDELFSGYRLLSTGNEQQFKVDKNTILTFFLYECLRLKIYSSLIAASLHKEDKAFMDINGEDIYNLAFTLAGYISTPITTDLTEEIQQKKKSIFEMNKEILMSMLTTKEDTSAINKSILKNVGDILSQLYDNPSMRITINNKEINKKILQNKLLTDMITSIIIIHNNMRISAIYSKSFAEATDEEVAKNNKANMISKNKKVSGNQ